MDFFLHRNSFDFSWYFESSILNFLHLKTQFVEHNLMGFKTEKPYIQHTNH